MPAVSWFMLGLAAGFLITATMSFAFHGLFGFYYLLVGGVCVAASLVTTLVGLRQQPRTADRSKVP